MKRAILCIVASTLLCTLPAAFGVEPIWRYAVELGATPFSSPPKIALSWVADPYAVSYTISRKAPGDTAWKKLASLAGNATGYNDSTAAPHTVYEYQVEKSGSQEVTYSGFGYVQAAIDAPLVDHRGKVILLVDSTYATDLSAELARLEQDLVGDGWSVVRRDVARDASVATIKSIVVNIYNSDPANVTALFLFGHIAVPYSGALAPDGHASHKGAWPADVYYADVNGKWSDISTTFVSTATDISPEERDRLTNVPRDGKFDPSTIPSAVELELGRVDFADMPGYLSWQANPTFPSELDLLRNYLNKDHAYRTRAVTLPRRGLLEQFLGMRNGEAFAATGYRACSAFFAAGTDVLTDLNVQTNDQPGIWVPTLASNTYLWAYGDGAGSYASVSGLGNAGNYNTATSVEIVSNDVKAAFFTFFGSWLGDWNTQDNFLRAALATPTYGLAAVWSGRPHWFFHPMALGETIGYCARLTQNNDKTYRNQVNNFTRGIHVALQGDPTLRLHPVLPPTQLQGSAAAGSATLSWTGSAEADLGYHVYRASASGGPYVRLTATPVASTSYTDPTAPAGATYMVRAVRLETSASGTYENASQGVFWSAP